MRLFASTLALLAATVVAPSLAHADDLFTLSPYPGTANNQTLVFTLPSSPALLPSQVTSTQFYTMSSSPETINGVSRTGDNFYFNTPANGGGFYDDYSNIMGYGAQLFTGLPSSPTFTLGTYTLYQSDVAGVLSQPYSVLTISTAPTPEPSSLALLGTGVLGLASFARRRFLK